MLPGTELTKNNLQRVEIKYDEVVKIMKLHSWWESGVGIIIELK